MNEKLNKLANKLELLGVVLTLWAAMRADGGLGLWLPLVLAGMGACLLGAGLSFLCSEKGRVLRRRHFGRSCPAAGAPAAVVLAFPKAG